MAGAQPVTPHTAPEGVLLFAHGHVLRVLAASWLGLPPEDGGRFALGTAALSVVGHERETRVVETWNQDWCRMVESVPRGR